MKRNFLLFVLSLFCFLRFQVAAQERLYMVTETELTQLENISKNLRISRQKLQSQANDLTERLRAQESKAKTLTEKLQQAESKVKTLNSQLQTELQTLKVLRQSYTTYEQEVTQRIANQQAIIDKQKDKLHRRMITIIVLSAALILIGVATGIKYLVKFKFSLLHPP